MICDTIYLRPGEPDIRLCTMAANDEAELAMGPRPAIIVFPGGGYTHLSPREAEPIAKKFFAAGFQAFILYYSIGEKARFPRPLEEASMAISYVRAHAEQYHVDPARVFVVGFSAGGHLAASIGTLFDRPEAAFPGMEPGSNRPTGMILSYAVTCVDTEKIARSFTQTLGGDVTKEELLRWSPADHVTEQTPPAYIWHTANDKTVPILHSLIMAQRLAEKKIPFELHVFPDGPHGLALANAQTAGGKPDFIRPDAAQWIDEAIDWAKRV